MKKKLFSVLIVLFTFSNQKVFAEEIAPKEMKIQNYSYIDIGFSGLSLNTKYSRDITPYYELSGKLAFGGIATSVFAPGSYGGNYGLDFSIENKFFFYKTNKHYSKRNKMITSGFYIKGFAGITKDLLPTYTYNSVTGVSTTVNSPITSFFPVLGTGIGWKEITNGFGGSLGLDIGSTIQKPDGQGFQGMFFIRPEISLIWAF
ncbi:MAG: hypothetical protein AABZ74_01345 [Cyanobacteriota bacterium]